MSMIMRLYGKHYAIKTLYVTPADQGHAAVARDRVYLILLLKAKVVQLHDVEEVYKECR